MVFEASVEVPPDSSMRILASRTLLMVPQVALVVPQVALGQVEIPVGIQALPSRSSPCMDFKASFDVVEAAKSLLTRLLILVFDSCLEPPLAILGFGMS